MTSLTPVRVGIIGCGNISPAYIKGCAEYDILKVVALADMNPAAADARAKEFGIERVLTVDELIADPDIDLVINLTIPSAHAPVNRRILLAGKHAYTEKPFGLNRAEGAEVLALAREKGLLVGCAPDTYLGPAWQTARKVLDDGLIGEPSAAFGSMLSGGPESWHPSPEFFYKHGGGPLFDMGPYYLSALVHLLGPVKMVTAMAKKAFAQRTVGSGPLQGNKIDVDIFTHLSGLLEFENGVQATTIFSFDTFGGGELPRLEIYGHLGTLHLPDPNHRDGELKIRLQGEKDWTVYPNEHMHTPPHRGIGVADMAYAIRTGRSTRVAGEIANHVLDIMCAFGESAQSHSVVHLLTSCVRPEMFPIKMPARGLDS